MIDTHCHLDAQEFDLDRAAVVARAQALGLTAIVVPSVARENFAAVASVCREYALCTPAYGIHPMYVERAEEGDLQALRDLLAQAPACAVGEIGLDRYVEERDDARQELFFLEQLKIARDLNLPVLLHVRRAVDEVLKGLRKIKVCGGIAHAFNGSRQQAEEFIKLGFKLGFGGAMTHPRALHLRELATTLPLSSIVLETDAPDMAPEWLNRGRNEPGELPRIAAAMAELRQMEVTELLAASDANARAVLKGL